MEKWTVNGRNYFAAPVDTSEVRQWLADIQAKPTYKLITDLTFEFMDCGRNTAGIGVRTIEERLADWRRSRVIDEIDRRISERSK